MSFSQTNIPLPGIRGRRDETTGVTGLTISLYVATLDETLTVGDATFRGLRLRSREIGNWDSKNDLVGYQVDLTYDNEFPDEEGPNGGEPARWSFDTSFREERIQKHPDFIKLKEEYGWVELEDGKFGFPEIIYDRGRAAAFFSQPGLSQSFAESDKSPAFGFETYLSFGVVAEKRYLASSINPSIRQVGKVLSRLPGGPSLDLSDEKRNWLVMPPLARQTTDPSGRERWEITEKYMLSAPGGWPEIVYKTIQGS